MKTIKIVKLIFFAAIVLLSFTIGCSKSKDNNPSPGGSPGANEVWLQSSVFNPATLTVAVNATVKWTNKDSYAHTVTRM